MAVSNIAWDPAEDDAVGAVLRAEGVRGVEIAPTKWRDDPLSASAAEVAAYRAAWEDRGLEIVSLQSLFFGQPHLQLFGTSAVRTAMGDYVRRMIDLAAALGAGVLVFGSPKNRTRGDLSSADATAIATNFFGDMADYAASRGTAVCIEANPEGYGCDFITTTAEAAALCRSIDNSGLRVNGDLGGMTMSGEDPATSIRDAKGFLAHFHASEPHLAPLGAASDHSRAARALSAIAYAGWISIEMRSTGSTNPPEAIRKAIRQARIAYAPSQL